MNAAAIESLSYGQHLIYFHGSDARQQAIAYTPDKVARYELKRADTPKISTEAKTGSGTQRARKRPKAS